MTPERYDIGALFSSERGRRVLAWMEGEGRVLRPADVLAAMQEAELIWQGKATAPWVRGIPSEGS